MTLFTGHRHMQTHQRKITQVVIKAHFATPGIGNMALIALITQLTRMCVLRAMATDTGRAQFLGSHISGVTGIATQFGVWPR